VGRVLDSVTKADVAAVLEAEMAGTPVAEAGTDWNPHEELEPVLRTGMQSGGTRVWLSVNLDPGTYTWPSASSPILVGV